MNASICLKPMVAACVEFFTANHTSLCGFYDKNVTFHVEAFAFPRVGQFFGGHHKKRIAFHFRNIVTEFCHGVYVCPPASSQGQAGIKVSHSSPFERYSSNLCGCSRCSSTCISATASEGSGSASV